MHKYAVLLCAFVIILGESCRKDQVPYQNFDFQTAGLNLEPGFNTKHRAVLIGDDSYLICGTTTDSFIYTALLSEAGQVLEVNDDFGKGSAHDLIPIPNRSGQFLLLCNEPHPAAGEKSGFFVTVVDSTGRNIGTKVDNFGELIDQKNTLREYAKVYSGVALDDGGFFFNWRI
jgi:hypothetical protein